MNQYDTNDSAEFLGSRTSIDSRREYPVHRYNVRIGQYSVTTVREPSSHSNQEVTYALRGESKSVNIFTNKQEHRYRNGDMSLRRSIRDEVSTDILNALVP